MSQRFGYGCRDRGRYHCAICKPGRDAGQGYGVTCWSDPGRDIGQAVVILECPGAGAGAAGVSVVIFYLFFN